MSRATRTDQRGQFAAATGSPLSSFFSVQPPQQALPSARSPEPLQQPESFAAEAAWTLVFEEQQEEEQVLAEALRTNEAGRTTPGITVQSRIATALAFEPHAEPHDAAQVFSTVVATTWGFLSPQEEAQLAPQVFVVEAAIVAATLPEQEEPQVLESEAAMVVAAVLPVQEDPH